MVAHRWTSGYSQDPAKPSKVWADTKYHSLQIVIRCENGQGRCASCLLLLLSSRPWVVVVFFLQAEALCVSWLTDQ